MKKLFSAAVVSLTALSACGAPPSSVSDPNYFFFKMKDGGVSGDYNQAGFKSERIQFYLAQECSDKKLSGYSEADPDENGIVAFQGTCSGGLLFEGHWQFQRKSDGSVFAEGTLAKDGTIFFSQKTY